MTNEGRLLAWLVHCAASGEPCPTNDAICERFGYSSTAMASRLMSGLEKRGAIRVERLGRVRVVTIAATRAATARPEQCKPHWRRDGERPLKGAAGRFVAAPPVPSPVRAAPAFTKLGRGAAGLAEARRLSGPTPRPGASASDEAESALTPLASGESPSPQMGEGEAELALSSVEDAIAWVKREWPEMWARTRAIAAEQRMLPGEALFRAIEAGLERIDA